MAAYNGPLENYSLFNVDNFLDLSGSLTVDTANRLYLQLIGGVERGAVVFQSGLTTNSLKIPTGAQNGYVLGSDASGNGSWISIGSAGVSFANGSAASPSIYFTSETGTGLYKAAVNQIGIALGGVNYGTFTTTGLNIQDINLGNGSAANPSLAFISDGNTGFYRPSTDRIAIALGGVNYITYTQTQNQYVNPAAILATTNQLILGTTNTTTINATAPASSRVYTIPDAGGAANFIMSTFGSAQTIAGGLTSSNLLTASNGLTLITGALNLTSTSGAISLTGTTFTTNTQMTISATTNQLILGTTNTTTINATAPASSRVYTIPDAGADSSFVMTAGNQTIGGSKTFSSAILAASGSAASPSITFSGDSATGLYSSATSTLGIAAGGIQALTINPYAGIITNNLNLQNSSLNTGTVKTYNTSLNEPTFSGSFTNTYTAGPNTYSLTCSNSTANLTTQQAYAAFDNNNSTFWGTANNTYAANTGVYSGSATTTVSGVGTVSGEWITVDFGRSVIFNSYRILPRASNTDRAPLSWYLVGSNDNGTTWTVLDTQSAQTSWSASTWTFRTFTLSAYYGYRFYRFICTAVQSGSSGSIQVNIAELTFLRDYNNQMYSNLQVLKNAALTASPSSTSGLYLDIPTSTFTDSGSISTVSQLNFVRIGQPTITTNLSGLSITATNAATLYIDNAPTNGASYTITNPYALQIAAGKAYFGGGIKIPTGAVNGYVLTSDASGNDSWAAAAATTSTTAITLTNTTNQITMGTTNTTTINSVAPAASRTYTIADAGANDTFTMNNATQLLTNKTLNCLNSFFVDSTDNTKRATFQNSSAATGTTLYLISTCTTNRTISFADANGTVPLLDNPVVFSNKGLSTNCYFADNSDLTKKLNYDLSGATASTTMTLKSSHTANRTITLPDATCTLLGSYSINPYATGYLSTNFTTTATTYNLINAWNVSLNNGITHSGGAFTVPSSGMYAITYQISSVSGSTGQMLYLFTKNSTSPPTASYGRSSTGGTFYESTSTVYIVLSANDVIRFYAYTNGQSLVGNNNSDLSNTTFCSIYKIG